MEVSGALTKVLPRQYRGNTQGLLYIDNKGSAGCGGGGGGKQQWFYQRVVLARWAFSRDLLDQKSKSPLFPVAGGHGFK